MSDGNVGAPPPVTRRPVGSWRARRRESRLTGRRARRILAAAFVVGLVAVFAYLLFEPLRRSKAALVGLRPITADRAAPPWSERDFAAIVEATASRLMSPPTDLSSSRSPAELFGQRLRDTSPECDVLLAYVQAEAVSIDGRAVLLWGVAPGELEPRHYPIRDVLAGLAAHPAATKVLLLDVATPAPDRWSGRIDDTFPQLLAEACRDADDDIWVFASHDVEQRSHVSVSLDRSVFGYWLGRGLAGSADQDYDGYVRLRELHRYVETAVAMWVYGTTDGRESQTPRLIACGREPTTSDDPLIVPAPRWFRTEREDDALQHALAAAKAERETLASPESSPRSSQTASKDPSGSTPDTAKAVADREAAAGTGTEPASAENGASDAAAAAAPSAKQQLSALELLNAGWKLRDDLENRVTARPDPRRDMPHLWRAYVDRLAELEQDIVAGSARNRAAADRDLRRLVLPLSRWAASGIYEPDAAEPVRSLTAVRPGEPQWFADSFGLEEARSADGSVPMPPELKSVIETFDRLIAGSSREEFTKWLSELLPEQKSYIEVQLAGRLLQLPELDWPLLQETLAVRRTAERVAANREAAEWLPATIEDADTLRRSAENLLLQGIGVNRQELAGQLLAEAGRRYDAAAADVQSIRDAVSLETSLLDFAPRLIDWYRASQALGGPRTPSRFDSLALLGAIEELSSALDSPTPDDLDRIKAASANAETLFETVRAGLDADYVRGVLVVPPDPVDDYLRLRALLATTLPSAVDRAAIREAARRAEESLATAIPFDAMRAVPRRPVTRESHERLLTFVELECRLARLAVADDSDELLQPLFASCRAVTDPLPGAPPDIMPFESALAEFWQRTLPSRATLTAEVEAAAEPASRLAGLRAADRVLRLIDPRDAVRLNGFPSSKLRKEMLSKLLTWQARRMELELRDAPNEARDPMQAIADSYRQSAAAISGREPLRTSPERILIEGVSGVSLESTESATIELTISNTTEMPADVWLVVDYDPMIVSLDSTTGTLWPSWRLERQREGLTAGIVDPVMLNRPDRDGREPSLRLPPGGRQPLVLRLERRSGNGQPSRVVVRAISRPPETDGTETAAAIVRKDVSIALPSLAVAELLVDGAPGTIGDESKQTVVTPFPNRVTPYRLLLAGRTGTATTVDVSLFAIRSNRAAFGALPALDDLPTDIGLVPIAAADLLADWTDGNALFSVGELVLPADGTAVALPFPKPLPPGPNSIAPAAEQGVLVIVTDRATGRRSVHPVAVRPQHPRRYLEPFVRYDGDAQRIEITVQPRDLSLMPPGGSRVTCEVVDPLPIEAARRLAGAVTPDGTPAELFIETAGARLDAVTLRLTVDDYPRAFIYRVPLNGTRNDLTPESGIAAVRILAPPAGSAFRSPIDRIPVGLEVDAPTGTRWDSGDAVVLGLDQDRDRELRGEESISLFSDRQIAVAVRELAPGGLMSLGTSVTDFRLDLPATHVARGRVNILGCLIAGDRIAWSAPVEVTLDDVPPAIARLRLSRRQVVAGEPLQVTAESSDGSLSGVAQVLAGVDLDRSGEFGSEAKPVAAVREQGRWIATLDTAKLLPGPYFVLARAVDAVGIPGPYVRERFEVVTPEQIAAARVAAVNQVSGVVNYRGRPMSGFDVTLEAIPAGTDENAENAPPATTSPIPAVALPPVTTDAQGAFTIKRVPPGKYQITAAGLYNNRRRTGTADVIVPPAPDEVPPLEVEVDPR